MFLDCRAAESLTARVLWNLTWGTTVHSASVLARVPVPSESAEGEKRHRARVAFVTMTGM